MKRISKLAASDKYIISAIVDRFHVLAPDTEVLAKVKSAYLYDAHTRVTPGYLKQVETFAVNRHRTNRDLFRRVGLL